MGVRVYKAGLSVGLRPVGRSARRREGAGGAGNGGAPSLFLDGRGLRRESQSLLAATALERHDILFGFIPDLQLGHRLHRAKARLAQHAPHLAVCGGVLSGGVDRTHKQSTLLTLHTDHIRYLY